MIPYGEVYHKGHVLQSLRNALDHSLCDAEAILCSMNKQGAQVEIQKCTAPEGQFITPTLQSPLRFRLFVYWGLN